MAEKKSSKLLIIGTLAAVAMVVIPVALAQDRPTPAFSAVPTPAPATARMVSIPTPHEIGIFALRQPIVPVTAERRAVPAGFDRPQPALQTPRGHVIYPVFTEYTSRREENVHRPADTRARAS